MKLLRRTLIALVVLVVGLLVLLMVRGGTIIRQAVNTAGPKVLGVPVSVQDVSFLPLNGHVRLEGLQVGNPAGYKTEGVFKLGLVEVILNPLSLFSDTIVIESVKVVSPEITYERALADSNIGALMAQLGGATNAAPEEKSAAGGKKVIIRDLQVNGARVKVSVTALQGLAAPLPLPPVHLTGIGEESEGTSFVDAISKILGAVFGVVTDVVVGAGKLVVEGVTVVGGAAVDGAKVVGGAAVDGAKVVGGAAVDGAKAVGGAAAGGVKAVGGAAVGGVKAVGGAAGKITDGIGGLFKGKDEKKE